MAASLVSSCNPAPLEHVLQTTGLPPEAHAAATQLVKIPMANFEFVRSLNLATSVGESSRAGCAYGICCMGCISTQQQH